MLEVIQIENKPVNSNCFVVFDKQKNNECLVIDPGSENESEIVSFLINNALTVSYIILTHEHFDHIWSVKALMKEYPQAQLISNKVCGEMIIDKKKNCSLYYNQVGFESPEPSLITEEMDNQLSWNGYIVFFLIHPDIVLLVFVFF